MLVMDDIIRKAQDGDVEAIEYIFNKYKSLIWKSVRKSYIKSGDWQDIYKPKKAQNLVYNFAYNRHR